MEEKTEAATKKGEEKNNKHLGVPWVTSHNHGAWVRLIGPG